MTIDELLHTALEPSGQKLKDDGIKKALSHVPDDYRSVFERTALSFTQPFTSEDVILKIGMPPSHSSAVGAMINGLAKRGLIRKTGQYVKSSRPSCHAAIMALWVKR